MREPSSQAEAKNLVVAAIVLNDFLSPEDKIEVIALALVDEVEAVKKLKEPK